MLKCPSLLVTPIAFNPWQWSSLLNPDCAAKTVAPPTGLPLLSNTPDMAGTRVYSCGRG